MGVKRHLISTERLLLWAESEMFWGDFGPTYKTFL